MKGFGAVFVLATIGAAAGSLSNQGRSSEPPEATAKERAAQDKASARMALEAAVRTEVLSSLRDPGSATFKGPISMPRGWVCGNVNSRNAFGGYTGYKGFIFSPVDGGRLMFEEE